MPPRRSTKLAADLAETRTQSERPSAIWRRLPEPGPAAQRSAAAREAASQARREEAEARATIDRLRREAQVPRRATSVDRSGGTSLAQARRERRDGSAGHLNERRRALEQEIADLAERPAAIAAEQRDAGARGRRGGALPARQPIGWRPGKAGCATRPNARAAPIRRWPKRASAARGSRCKRRRQTGGGRARPRDPRAHRRRTDALAPISPASAEGQTPADAAATAARLARLTRERDGIGPINLVAESEAAEIGAQADALEHERADLTEAIAKLRRGAPRSTRKAGSCSRPRSSGSTGISPPSSPGCSAAARPSWH